MHVDHRGGLREYREVNVETQKPSAFLPLHVSVLLAEGRMEKHSFSYSGLMIMRDWNGFKTDLFHLFSYYKLKRSHLIC